MAGIPFSEQLRQAIESSGTSRYALARSVGISDSALSRFMSGERGLTLASLDKLADALGLEVFIGVQKIPRHSPKGRRPARGSQMTTKMTKALWQTLADDLAKDAHENYFPSRRGVWFLPSEGALCLYNNNPYKDPMQRNEELAEFRDRMRAEGVKELAYATYPPEGREGAGYTYAMLIDAGKERMNWVADTMMRIVQRAIADRDRSIEAEELALHRKFGFDLYPNAPGE
jgi:transcriptional regulator with XRE-family HTH domain